MNQPEESDPAISAILPWSLDGYQQRALRTAETYTKQHEGLSILALGVAGEAGEVADYVKKVVGHGHPLDPDKLAKELGDVLWYIAVLADLVGFTLEGIGKRNIAKLRARYPDGFTSERSINRKEGP